VQNDRVATRRTLRGIITGTTENWLADQASSISAALAFYCAFSLAPLLIIIVTIAGWIVGDELAHSYLRSQVTMLFGAQSAEVILSAMQSAQSEEGIWATAVSAAMLLVGATTVFAALESALQQIWGGRDSLPRGWRAFLRARLVSFGFILAIGFLLLVSLTLTTALVTRCGISRARSGCSRRSISCCRSGWARGWWR
jgi:membrane protein